MKSFFFFPKRLFKKSLKHPNAGQIARAWSWEQTCPGPPAASVSGPALDKTIQGRGWADGVSQLSQVLKFGGDRCGVVAGSSLGQVRKSRKSFTITMIL